MNKRTGAIAGAGVAVAVVAAIVLPNANASTDRSQDPKEFSPLKAAQVGRTLASDLGDSTAGWYVDGRAGRLVMNVLDERTADRVRAEGAVARIVKNSMAELQAATRKLSDTASVPGTAWSIDPKTNRVSVIADRTVTGARMATLKKATDAMPGMVTVKRSAGEFTPLAGDDDDASAGAGNDSAGSDSAGNGNAGNGNGGAGNGAGGQGAGGAGGGGASGNGQADDGVVNGGDAIFGGGVRCSLGFNVQVGGEPAFLTAGHCGNESQTWSRDQQGAEQLGTVQQTVFPVNDFALVKYDDPATEAPSSVDLKDGTAQEITQAAEANVGMQVQRSGSTTGVSSGTVTGLNATVNYGNGDIVNGLIQTDMCAEPGDSGGAMFSGNLAVGLTSGGSGDCTQGGETFFEPVTRALEETGAQLGAGGAGEGDGAADSGAGGDDAADGGTDGGIDGGADAGDGSAPGDGLDDVPVVGQGRARD